MASDHSTPDDLAELERFVVDNDDLELLEARLGLFNIFDALRIGRVEIRHSNVLAWLLDPAESHGQGDLFLRAVLIDMLRQSPESKRPFRALDLDGHELGTIEVHRERDHIDLAVVCEDPKFIVAIENKVDSGEHSDQLQRYESAVARSFPEHKPLFIFLSPDGFPASDEDWIPYSYKSLHKALHRSMRRAAGTIGEDVSVFINHYLSTVQNELMENAEIAAICRKIYAQHRRAINLIWEHQPISGGEGTGVVADFLNAETEAWHVAGGRERYIMFYPRAWLGVIFTDSGELVPSMPCKVYLECEGWGNPDHRLVAVRLVVGPGADQAKRLALINTLRAEPFNLTTARKQASETWTRMNSKTLAKWPTTTETPSDKIRQELVEWLTSMRSVLDRLPEAMKSIG